MKRKLQNTNNLTLRSVSPIQFLLFLVFSIDERYGMWTDSES